MKFDITPKLTDTIEIDPGYAQDLFDAMHADGDRPKSQITLEDVEGYQHADTFKEFLKINNMKLFDD